MNSKLLQGVGVVAILGLVVGSIAALLIVKERIHVTIAAEETAARRGPGTPCSARNRVTTTPRAAESSQFEGQLRRTRTLSVCPATKNSRSGLCACTRATCPSVVCPASV